MTLARMTTRKAIAYVDGFNFYYGAVRKRPEYKWLDLPRMCDALLPDCSVALRQPA